jgi:hypothetical protein
MCCYDYSPLALALEGRGVRLTDAAGGVDFDITGTGVVQRVAWTLPGTGSCWLTLDRNGNGRIDNGTELFGTFTPQPEDGERNGFKALSVYDRPHAGGNADSFIDARDEVFSELRVWCDTSHDGISDPSELIGLSAAGIGRIALDYREAQRRDQHGNLFRYRAKIFGDHQGKLHPWIWDVYLKVVPTIVPDQSAAH